MSDQRAPDFEIYDDGSPVAKTVRAQVIQITVDERINQAALCTIELRDDGTMSDGTKFKLGSELRVAMGYTGAWTIDAGRAAELESVQHWNMADDTLALLQREKLHHDIDQGLREQCPVA